MPVDALDPVIAMVESRLGSGYTVVDRLKKGDEYPVVEIRSIGGGSAPTLLDGVSAWTRAPMQATAYARERADAREAAKAVSRVLFNQPPYRYTDGTDTAIVQAITDGGLASLYDRPPTGAGQGGGIACWCFVRTFYANIKEAK